jgi:hypothetical protein
MYWVVERLQNTRDDPSSRGKRFKICKTIMKGYTLETRPQEREQNESVNREKKVATDMHMRDPPK